MESNPEAMSKKQYILLGTLLLLVAGSCNRYKYPGTPALADNPEAAEGQKVYMEYCQSCHPDGEAGLGPSIYYLPGFLKRFQARHGLGVMPEFREEHLSDEELDKIIAYLKVLDKARE